VRDSFAASERRQTPALGGGRIGSEWVADFRRNRWPDCVGISGRLASDYACHRDSRRVPVAKSPGKCARSI